MDYKDPAAIFRDAPLPDSKGQAPGGKGDGKAPAKTGIQIVSYTQQAPEPDKSKGTDDDFLYLPSGSILTGTLINGMDAPTSQGLAETRSRQLCVSRKKPSSLTGSVPMCANVSSLSQATAI